MYWKYFQSSIYLKFYFHKQQTFKWMWLLQKFLPTEIFFLFVCLFVWEFHLFINPPLQMSPNTFRWKLAKIKPFYLSLGYTSISASVKGLKWSKTYLDKALGFMYQTLNTLTFSYISRRFLLALPKKNI